MPAPLILPFGVIHDTIKPRLRAALHLTPAAEQTPAHAAHLARELRDDGSWRDLAPGEPAHLERTLVLAKARRDAPGMLDAPLRRALDFWLAHDFQGADWRGNGLAVPRLVGQTALLCENELSAGAWGKAIEILARSRLSRWVPGEGWSDWTGTDLLRAAYNVLLRGCLENNPALFDGAFSRIFSELRPAPPGRDGIQSDLSYRGEGDGLAFAEEMARFISLAHGTPWQAPADGVKLFAAFLLDAQQWMVHAAPPGDAADTAPADPLKSLAVAVGQLSQSGNPPRRQELTALTHRLLGQGVPLSGHRHFWRANLSVHQRPGYSARLGLGSVQTARPEAGAFTLLLRQASENRPAPAQGGHGLPGITVLETPDGRPAIPPFLRPVENRFSGGVGEGDYGMAALRLAEPGLHGRKAWFFFDESIVCLGSGHRAAGADAAVRTRVDERAFTGEATVWPGGASGGTPFHLAEPVTATVRRVAHAGVVYDFPGQARVELRADADEVSPARFALTIEHGAGARESAYACTILPVGDGAENHRRAEAEIAQVEVLANTPALQAVRHRGLRLVGVTFWEAGVLRLPGGGRVAANQPCLLLCREAAPGETRLTLASPAREPASVHVEYGGQCLCFDLPGGADAGRSLSRQL